MNLDEALALYFYLQHQPPGTRDEAAFQVAWKTIVFYGLQSLDRLKFPPITDGQEGREQKR